MNSPTLEDLGQHFDNKLTCVMSSLELRSAVSDPNCQKHIVVLNNELQNLENILGMMKTALSKQKKQLASIEGIKEEFSSFIGGLAYTLNNIPQRLPNTQDNGPVETSNPSNRCNSSSASNEVVEKRAVTEKTLCPVIEYLRVDEFEDVPKYMKGRHTYNRVNSLVDNLNKSLKAKYKVLRMKKSVLNDCNRKRFDEYKQQENKDTKGVYFIVENDLKEFCNVKIDAANKAILTILRHTGRIREIRGAGITRYTVLESY